MHSTIETFMATFVSLPFIIDEIGAFIQTDGQTDRYTDMAQLTRLVILGNNIYTLWGHTFFCLLNSSNCSIISINSMKSISSISRIIVLL